MIEKIFQLGRHGTTWKREIIAGLTTFAAMSYILVVNPSILAAAGMDPQAMITVTAVAAAIGCVLMAVMTNYPIAQAPGMSTNSYFAFIICVGMGVHWQAALSMTFWNGVLFLLLSLSGLRTRIIEAIPEGIKIGIQCGIGLLIAFVGLRKAGVVVASSATLVTKGDIVSPEVILAMIGLIVMTVLTARKFNGAIILTILGMAAVGLFISGEEGASLTPLPAALISFPVSMKPTFLQLDWLYPFTHFKTAFPIVITLFMLDLFDTIGTLVSLTRRIGCAVTKTHLPKMGRALCADASATIAGAILGTSTTCAYVESATGIEVGGRTGLTAIVVGGCFVMALFFEPVIVCIPGFASAPALVLVGIFMAQGLQDLNYNDIKEVGPSFVTMIMIPLTFSITDGISMGLIFYVCLMLFCGEGRRVPVLTYVLAILFMLFYFMKNV